jgi:hypothetical protein
MIPRVFLDATNESVRAEYIWVMVYCYLHIPEELSIVVLCTAGFNGSLVAALIFAYYSL